MDRALQVREILATRGLTLYSVSRRSAELFGRSSPFYVPHNWYYRLTRTFSIATIYQILALSHITNFRLPDWLAVFGFDLDAIFGLQVVISRQQTILLDSTVHDPYAWIPWVADRPPPGPVPSIAPLGHLLTWAIPKRARDLLAPDQGKFLYAMVGERDSYALPYFVPGSIVRADVRRAEELLLDRKTSSERPFFLVQHDFGFICSRLIRLGKNRVLLHCPQRPCGERELCTGKDARILGAIDAEIRVVAPDRGSRRAGAKSAAFGKPHIGHHLDEPRNLPNLLLHSRRSLGLSFREASSLSRWVADTLSDELYFAAPSTLSDYETLSAPPRHIQKIITLCLLYGIGFEPFLRACGLPLEQAGREPIPDAIIRRPAPGPNHRLRDTGPQSLSEPSGFLAALMTQWEEVPLFLRSSLDEITGLKGFSLSDVFWAGGDQAQPHPLLADAAFVVVNRRAKKPTTFSGEAACQQPLYVLLRRDGSYVCGRCTLDEGNLTLHGYPGSSAGTQQFRDGTDAEVVGRVTAIVRHVL